MRIAALAHVLHDPNDERYGGWSQEQLVEMDSRFVKRSSERSSWASRAEHPQPLSQASDEYGSLRGTVGSDRAGCAAAVCRVGRTVFVARG